MPLSRSKFFRRVVRWLVPAAALALAPKCLLCVVAYLGLGTALGLGGPELCGVPASMISASRLAALAASVLVAAGLLAWRFRQERLNAATDGGGVPSPRKNATNSG